MAARKLKDRSIINFKLLPTGEFVVITAEELDCMSQYEYTLAIEEFTGHIDDIAKKGIAHYLERAVGEYIKTETYQNVLRIEYKYINPRIVDSAVKDMIESFAREGEECVKTEGYDF